MKLKLLFFLLTITANLSAQKLPREVLNGKLVADAMSVDDILVTNKTANTAAISNEDGTFQIMVRVKDTLVFSGFNFPRQILVLNEADLKFNVVEIKLEGQAANLDEVVINPKALSGDLKRDSDNIKITHLTANIDNLAAVDKLYEGDEKSSPQNKLMPGYVDPTYMMDFVKIGQKLVRSFKRSEADKTRSSDVSKFSVIVQNRFSDDFFRNTLKIDQSELQSFLNFCEKDPASKNFLTEGQDFELIKFLELKKQEFRALKKE